jgi:NADH:ubiquinone oxidoreductase subunit 6 (subunit J)
MLDSIIFWAFAVMAVGGALVTVCSRNMIHAALALIVVFMSVAGFYLLNNADFLAIAQIIIYVVGLTIMMLFAVMFTGEKPYFDRKKANSAVRVGYGIVALYVFALFLRTMLKGFANTPVLPVSPLVAAPLAQEGSTRMLGNLLFMDYALPFEIASILLLAAMIGAIVIAKKRFSDSPDQTLGENHLAVDVSSAPPASVIAALREKRLQQGDKSQVAERLEAASSTGQKN